MKVRYVIEATGFSLLFVLFFVLFHMRNEPTKFIYFNF